MRFLVDAVRPSVQFILRSGGQTGVDRAALDYAIATAIPYTGWCPLGGWAEDLPTPPGLLAKYPQLTETPSTDPGIRTEWNVRDSDATLVVTDGGSSPGTNFTVRCAEQFKRPCHILTLSQPTSHAAAARWLVHAIESVEHRPFVLNVAGPRESQAPGIYDAAFAAIERLLREASVM